MSKMSVFYYTFAPENLNKNHIKYKQKKQR
jgi:hypothetical protein